MHNGAPTSPCRKARHPCHSNFNDPPRTLLSLFPHRQSPDAQIKAAYCNADFLVIHSNGQPNHKAFLDQIPTPPGAGGEGLNTQGVYKTCHTRTKVDQWQSYKVRDRQT